ncbi:hypothetical protein [Mesomycoplasma ovipneumoniae]
MIDKKWSNISKISIMIDYFPEFDSLMAKIYFLVNTNMQKYR